MYSNYFPSWKPIALNNWNKFHDCFFVIADDGSKWYCVFIIEGEDVAVSIPTDRVLPELKLSIQQGIVTEMYYSNSKKQYKKVIDPGGFMYSVKEVTS